MNANPARSPLYARRCCLSYCQAKFACEPSRKEFELVMIRVIQLIRNIGKFDSVAAGANIPLARLIVVYAENARGKTTLAAILRSLSTGESIPISERRRLTAQHPPHVIIDCDGGPPSAMFQNNAWNRTLLNMAVFDDTFVDDNVCSGL